MNSLEEEFTPITFSELKHLSYVDLPQCVSLEAALKICKVQEATGNEIFHLWVHKLLKGFEGITFTTTDWQTIINFFSEIIQQLTECGSNEIDEDIQNILSSILCDAMELLKWLQTVVANFEIPIYCIVLGFALQTVIKYLEFQKKWNSKIGDKNSMEDALLLHNFVLQILNQNMNLLIVADKQGFEKLTELIEILCIYGEQALSIDIKTIVETWKCVTKLSVQCAKFYNASNRDHTSDPSGWITRPLRFLIKEIGRNLTVVLNEETFQQPLTQIEKYLRVTNFYLKLLQRLTADFPHEKFPCSDELLKTLVILRRSSFSNGTELKAVVDKYVTHELSEILRLVFKNPSFVVALHNAPIRKLNTFFCISKDFLNTVIIEKDIDFIDHNIDVFIQNLTYLTEDAFNFCSKDNYNQIIEQYAALAILNSTNKLINYFKLSILKQNLIIAQTSTDILLILARSSYTAHVELLKEFNYWRRCNEKFTILTTNPSELYVRKLLLTYFVVCKSSKNTTDSILFEKEHALQMNKSNYRFLLAIGLQELSKHESTMLPFTTQLNEELTNLLTKWDTSLNIESYYKMIIIIKLLSTFDMALQIISLENIINFVLRLLSTPIGEKQNFCKIIETAFNFIIIHQKEIKSEMLLQILHALANDALIGNLSNGIINIYCSFLNIALKNTNLRTIAEKMLLKQCNNPNAKLLDFLYITETRKRSQNSIINLNLCKNITLSILPKHECRTSLEIAPAKRLRVEESSDVKVVLNEMLHESEKLMKLTTMNDELDINIINKIINNLHSILSKNKSENESSSLF